MAHPCSDISSGLELCLGTDPAGEVSGGSVLRSLLSGGEGVQVLAGAEAGPVPRPTEEAPRHHRVLRRAQDRPHQDLCGRIRSSDTQCVRTLAAANPGIHNTYISKVR